MPVEQSLFPVNKLDLENPTILIRLEQADTTKGKNVVVSDPRPVNVAGPTPSHKVVVEKISDGEAMITITIRVSTMGSHERKAQASTLARDGGKRKPTIANSEQAVTPLASRSDRHGRPERATPSRGQTTHRAGPTGTIDGLTTHRVGQTTPSQDKAPRMIKL
jgi:hypothetical protein